MVLHLQEINVSGWDDAHQFAAHFAINCDGDATEAVACLGLEDVPHSLIGAHHHGICDEALLIALEEEGRKEGMEGRKEMDGDVQEHRGRRKRSSEGNIKESLPTLYSLGLDKNTVLHMHKKTL